MSRTKSTLAALSASLVLLLAAAAPAAELAPVPLPPPRTDGGMPLMKALSLRATSRAFAPDPIPPQLLSDLLWAAWGINRPGEGKRTAPSARNVQEIDVVVVRADGAWVYDAAGNSLLPLAAGDHRALCGSQEFVRDAPVTLVYVADRGRAKGAKGGVDDSWMWADAGFIGQNVYLFCASEGLATGVRALIDRPALSKALGLGEGKAILLAQSVGYPKKREGRGAPLERFRSPAALSAALFLATVLAFSGVVRLGYIPDFDDGDYVASNPPVAAGVTPGGLRWALTAVHHANWHPVTWISHMADVSLFGPGPAGPHAVNLLLHGANGILLFLLLRRLTGATGRSLVAAALFALHPFRVESVAWVAERKDVLSALFALLALHGWLRYVERPSIGRYVAPLLLFALGLASKPMVVTLPFVLLLLDGWPLGRLRVGGAPLPVPEGGVAAAGGARPLRSLLLEKAPWFALSAAAGATALLAQEKGGVVERSLSTLGERLAAAVVAYARYLGKTFLPLDLAAFYPLPPGGYPPLGAAGAALLLAALTAGALLSLRRRPYLATGWFWFLGTLVPVSGLVRVGSQAMADRYTYLPHAGLLLAVVWGAGDGWDRAFPGGRGRRLAPGVAAAALLALLAVLTHRQVGYWRDQETLFRHAAAVTEGNWFARFNVGAALDRQGRHGEAAAEYAESLAGNPDHPRTRYNLGSSLARAGREREAEGAYRAQLARWPGDADTLNNLAWLYASAADPAVRRPVEALVLAEEAVRLAPTANNLDTLAEARLRTGDRAGAALALGRAAAVAPPAERGAYERRRTAILP